MLTDAGESLLNARLRVAISGAELGAAGVRLLVSLDGEKVLTYADVCSLMLTYAGAWPSHSRSCSAHTRIRLRYTAIRRSHVVSEHTRAGEHTDVC